MGNVRVSAPSWLDSALGRFELEPKDSHIRRSEAFGRFLWRPSLLSLEKDWTERCCSPIGVRVVMLEDRVSIRVSHWMPSEFGGFQLWVAIHKRGSGRPDLACCDESFFVLVFFSDYWRIFELPTLPLFPVFFFIVGIVSRSHL